MPRSAPGTAAIRSPSSYGPPRGWRLRIEQPPHKSVLLDDTNTCRLRFEDLLMVASQILSEWRAMDASFRTSGIRAGSLFGALVMLCTLVVVAGESPHIASAAPVGVNSPAKFNAIQPCRLLDTREAAYGGAPVNLQNVTVAVAGRCEVPAEATSASITVTVTDTVGPGHIRATPAGETRLETSVLNWVRSHTIIANSTIVKLGSGAVDLYVQGHTHLVVDVNGYFTSADASAEGRLVAVAPRRVLDTRVAHLGENLDANIPAYGPWAPGAANRVPLPSGVPADAVAVSINLTTTESPGSGFFTAYKPGSSTRPNASSLNTDLPGQIRAAGMIVPVTADGFMLYSHAGGHVIIDINGYFTGPSADTASTGLFVSHNPTRVLDTRSGEPIYSGGSIRVDTTDLTGDVMATVTNVTMTETVGAGFVTAFPARNTLPVVSSLNTDAERATIANMAVVSTSNLGINYFAMRMTHLVVDVSGYFTGSPFASDNQFVEQNTRPRFTETRLIGHSVNGQPITAYRMGTPGGKTVVAIAAIHGDEWGSQAVTQYLLDSATIPDGLDVWVIPSANPDGRSSDRRTNANLVDLNRNFATGNWAYAGRGTEKYSGPWAASEPETLALQHFILSVQPKVVVWWHQVGNHVDDNKSVANYSLLLRFAVLTGMAVRDTPCNPNPCRGTATAFVNQNVAGATSFVVELPFLVAPTMAQRQALALLHIGQLS